ncbi:PKD domain-containing protein, partial [Gammaproteobacteria bacterium]|nr:PKD domain-containing protein [Gammaproteobacteria bacterium]
DGVAGEVVSVTATATDSDGELASTSWLIGDEIVASGTSARLPLSDGSTTVTFRATDDDGDSKSTSVTITVEAPIETEEEFVTEYNGIAAPSFLSEEINTVSVFDINKLKLRSCIRLTLGGEPYSLNGYEQYDMNFNLLSLDDLTFRLVDFRPFNLNGSRNQFGETPDCSGQFELSSNVYKDIVAIPGATGAGNLKYDYFDLVIDLIDMDSLLFRLREISITAGTK